MGWWYMALSGQRRCTNGQLNILLIKIRLGNWFPFLKGLLAFFIAGWAWSTVGCFVIKGCTFTTRHGSTTEIKKKSKKKELLLIGTKRCTWHRPALLCCKFECTVTIDVKSKTLHAHWLTIYEWKVVSQWVLPMIILELEMRPIISPGSFLLSTQSKRAKDLFLIGFLYNQKSPEESPSVGQ